MSLTLETENIVVTGGGTGGHTFASVKFLELFKKWYPNKSLIYIGSGNDFEKDIFKNIKDVQLKYISTGKFRRALDKRNISDFFSFFSGIFQSYRFLKKRKVSYILSTGGYVSLGPVIAARMLSIPIIVHEQTSIPGIANRLAFRLSDINLYSFDSGCFSGEKYLFSGNPSDIISNKPVHDLRDDQKKDKPLLFITGGANGSFILNEFVLKNIDWINHNFEVFLQYGTNPINIERFENEFKKINKMDFVNKRFFPRNDMLEIFARIDCMLARAGAGTISDIIEYNIPSVLIPLKGSAGNEQYVNAKMLSEKDAAILLEEKEFSDNKLKQALMNVYINRERISENLKDFERFDEQKVKKIFDGFLEKNGEK